MNRLRYATAVPLMIASYLAERAAVALIGEDEAAVLGEVLWAVIPLDASGTLER
jgi:hypothetical protein